MRNLFLIVLIACSTQLMLFAQISAVKPKIDSLTFSLKGEITQTKLEVYIDELKLLMCDTNILCFNSLGMYNHCTGTPDSIGLYLMRYMDDLIGVEIQRVELKAYNKPWDDEEYYTLKYCLFYDNENPKYPVQENFDTIIIDVDKGEIRNIIYAREWIDLATFGE